MNGQRDETTRRFEQGLQGGPSGGGLSLVGMILCTIKHSWCVMLCKMFCKYYTVWWCHVKKKVFINCFLKVPLAYLGSTAAAVQDQDSVARK